MSRALGFLFFFAVLLWLYSMSHAHAQTNHHQHHAFYQNWVNKHDKGCCNNQDCGELAQSDERTTGGVLSVRIEGQWCPVLPHHYLKRGNVPNASTSHICVQKYSLPGQSNCDRLLCYQPQPGI